MSFLKGMNKRGQDLPLTGLAIMVLVVLVIAAVGYGIYNVVNYGSILGGNAPKSLQVAITVCQGLANVGGNVQESYCNQFREVDVDGVTMHVSCDWLEANKKLGDASLDGGCSGYPSNPKIWCETQKLKDNVFVGGADGRTCGEWKAISKLDLVINSCKAFVGSNSKPQYCNELREVEIAGVKQYVTCEWLKTKGNFNEADTPGVDGFCTGQPGPDAKIYCDGHKLADDVMVQGNACSTYS
jgi:hypothetical protein